MKESKEKILDYIDCTYGSKLGKRTYYANVSRLLNEFEEKIREDQKDRCAKTIIKNGEN